MSSGDVFSSVGSHRFSEKVSGVHSAGLHLDPVRVCPVLLLFSYTRDEATFVSSSSFV